MKSELYKRHDEIAKLVEMRLPFAEIARRLNVARDTATSYIKKHWPNYRGNAARKNIKHYEQRIPILQRIANGSNLSASIIRMRLIEEGYKEKIYERCGLSEWMGQPIPLELHHKNMNHYDNSLGNLQILCSNCHMQIHGYSNVKKKKKEI